MVQADQKSTTQPSNVPMGTSDQAIKWIFVSCGYFDKMCDLDRVGTTEHIA